MSYNFAICDDDSVQRDYLTQAVNKWSADNNFTINITCFPSAEAFLFQYSDEKSYDILLLDIEMGEISGVQLAHNVRKDNKEVQIIFVTGYMEYIADGYEVEALHYLLKPVTEDKLFAVLDRAVVKLKRNERAIILDLGYESVRVPLYEIRYAEVQRNYVTVYADNNYTIKTTLNDIEKQLDDNFYRAGRSYIVNLKYIRRVTKTEIHLSNGAVIPLPRGHYNAINRAIINKL
jgi:Response regulator of the LytR/AlgR family